MYAKLSTQQLLGKLFSNAGVYSIAIILTRVGGLILLPLYWQKLNPIDFGIIGFAQMVTIILGPILGLGLYDAVQRLYHEWSEDERPQYLAALWSISITFSTLICLGLYFLGKGLFSNIISQVNFSPYIELSIWISFCINLNLIPLTIMRVREDLIRFSIVTIGMFITQATAILIFIYIFDWKANGYLAGTLVGGVLWGGYFIVFMLREIRFPWSWHCLKEPLRYSLPTIPASILEGTGSIFDRFFLDKSVSLGMIGLYNLGNQLGGAINAFNQTLKASWVPFIIRVVTDRDDGAAILGRFSLYYIAAISITSLSVALLAEEMVSIFGGEQFLGVYPFIPWFALIYYLNSIGTAMGRGLDLAKKTSFTPIVPAVGILVNFFTMYLLIPKYGVWGAIMALLITTVARIGTHIGLAVFFYPRPMHIGSFIKINLIAMLCFLAGNNMDINHLGWSLLVKCLLIIGATGLIAWVTLDWRTAIAIIRQFKEQRKS